MKMAVSKVKKRITELAIEQKTHPIAKSLCVFWENISRGKKHNW
jgi:hypothetical protein